MNLLKNTNNRIIALVFALLMVANTSCDDVLQADPAQSIDLDLALTSKDGVAAAINGVYSRLRSLRLYGRDILLVGDALSDIGRATNNSGRLIGEYNNTVRSHFVQETWLQAYAAINEANLIMEALPSLTDPLATQAIKDEWTGSMLFIRALLHFDLVRIYAYDPGVIISGSYEGGIPIRTVATRTVKDALALKVSRDEVADVYTQIYTDLDGAIAKLPVTATNRYYANLGAAHALYSRVALYNEDYSKAISEATAAIAAGVGVLQSGNNYVNGWRAAANPESFFEVRFQIAAENNGVNESLQTTCNSIQSLAILGTPTQVSTVGGWGDLVPIAGILTELQLSTAGSGNLMTIVRSGTDVRGFLYDIGNGRGSSPKIECIKYIGKSGLVNLDNAPVLRASEMYLNRAEAYMSQAVPDEVAALADLNTLLAARSLPASALTGTALYDEIIRQRKLEFAFEGHRFFDLKRRGVDIVKVPNNVPYTDFRILPPLPQAELDYSPNLVQNPGY
jgi:starch-binding outer membrane protein, SusD/RagB family